MTELGRLEPVDLGTIWADEAQNFTPWLAKEANLAILGETIGIELELEAQERNVGPFRADILCKDTADGSWVLIENQLERTDHGHLSQLLTYAAGLHAVTIVWVAVRFTEEHRATLDWLNDVTGEEFRFFGLEIELWRIGSSLAAPKFNMFHLLHVERPAIEQAVGAPLYWQPLQKGFRISLRKEQVDPSHESDWPNQHEWLADKLELFDRVFRLRVKQLNAADWTPEPEPGGEENPEAA